MPFALLLLEHQIKFQPDLMIGEKESAYELKAEELKKKGYSVNRYIIILTSLDILKSIFSKCN